MLFLREVKGLVGNAHFATYSGLWVKREADSEQFNTELSRKDDFFLSRQNIPMAQKFYIALNCYIQILKRISRQITAASYSKLTKRFQECHAPRREIRIPLFSLKHEIGLKLILQITRNEIISAWTGWLQLPNALQQFLRLSGG